MNEIQQDRRFIANMAINAPYIKPEVKQFWNDNPLELQNFLMGLQNPPTKAPKMIFSTLKIIEIGTGPRSASEFKKAIEKSGRQVPSETFDLTQQPGFRFAERRQTIELVVASGKQLGLKNVTLGEIFKRARTFGLGQLPHEAVLQLAMQYPEQPKGEILLLATEPIKSVSGIPQVFCVNRDYGGRFLDNTRASPDRHWNGDDRWVFRRK